MRFRDYLRCQVATLPRTGTMPLGLTDTDAGTLAALTGKNGRHLLRGMVARALVQVSQMILWIEKLSEILIMEHISGELTLPLSSPGGGRLQPFIIRSPGMLAELSLCRRRSENRQSRTEDTHDRGSGRQTASLARRHGSFDSCRTALIHHRGCEGVHTSVPQ